MIQTRPFLAPARLFVALGLLLLGLLPAALPVPATAARPTLTLSRGTVASGDAVTVTGYYFRPGDTAVVSATFTVRTGSNQYAKQQAVTGAPVNSGGSFTASLTVPAHTIPATYQVTARDYHGGAAAANLKVLRLVRLASGQQSAQVSMVAGHYFYVVASGYKPGEAVTITASFPLYNGTTLTETKTATANGSGNIGELMMQVPWRAANATLALTATGQVSQQKGTAPLTVIHRPAVWLGSKSTTPGGTVAINGAGFVPYSQVTVAVTLSRPGTTNLALSKTVTTGQYGGFQTSLTVPTSTGQGNYTVSATDSIGGFQASTSLTVSVNAAIAIQPQNPMPGQKLTVTGGGYSASVPVQVSATFPLYGGGSRTVSTTAVTNGNGVFSAQLQVPSNAAAGPVAVMAAGPHTQSRAQIQVQHLGARITLTPSTVRPGSTVTVQGASFLPGARIDISMPVTLTSGAHQTLSTAVTADSHGQIAVQLHIPSNVLGGSYNLVARSEASGRAPVARLTVFRLTPSVSVSPASVAPGTTVSVRGSGYLPSTRVDISVTVRLYNGGSQTLTAAVTTNASGQFAAALRIPATVGSGTYTVLARSASGRSGSARLLIAKLAPSVVAVPATAVPGTQVTINGFGFAAGQTVTLRLNGQTLGTASANGSGQFSVKLTVPQGLATGSYTVTATSGAGRVASLHLAVKRTVATHFYFASLYTGAGYHEYLAFLNPTAIQAQVQIAYQPTVGAPRTKSVTIAPHSRFTEDVNADVGVHVSTAAAVASDLAMAAERLVTHGTDATGGPGATSPSTVWYFANGNTSHGYREYIAVQNSNSGPVQVAIHLQPTHHRPFTVYRNLGPAARTTFKINSYVRDAVGLTVTANGPVVANRTMYIHHGMASKAGVTKPQQRWYFAAGPRNPSARYWIGVINPSGQASYLTLHAYGPAGAELGTMHAWLKPFARQGYLINRIAHQTNAAVLVTTTQPSVVEQTTYLGRMHDASTDTFGVANPAKTWEFAVANAGAGQDDLLTLFNPNLTPIGVAVQFMTTSGAVVQRTYIVSPLSHEAVDLATVLPNQQVGIVAASSQPFVALNRQLVANGLGAMTSIGIPG